MTLIVIVLDNYEREIIQEFNLINNQKGQLTPQNKAMMYLVLTRNGYFESTYSYPLFVTRDKKYAEDYVAKYNRMLSKWQKYYCKLYDKHLEDDSDKASLIASRYYELHDEGEAYIQEIEVR